MILVVGGDSVNGIRQRALNGGRVGVEHWSGRKTRDAMRSIPKHTEAIVLVLDRVNHSLARKVRTEALHRGIAVFFQKRRYQTREADYRSFDLAHLLDSKQLRHEADPLL